MNKVILFLVIFSFLGCVEDNNKTPSDSVDLVLDDERADRTSEVRIRVDSLSVWMKPEIEMPTATRSTWTLAGRTSRNIAAIRGLVDGEGIDLSQLSQRKFSLALTPDNFEKALINGIFVEVQTSAGTHTIRLLIEGRLNGGEGSSYIYPYRRIQLTAQKGKPVFRATVSTRKDFETIRGTNDDDSEPTTVMVSNRKFHLDFQTGLLTWAASPYEDALVLAGESIGTNGKTYRRDSHIGVALVGLGLTSDKMEKTWPLAECDEQGDVHEQLACGPSIQDELIGVFARDFRSFIIDHYRANSTQIEMEGGAHRTQALLKVDSADIFELNDPNLGFDLSKSILLAHPDVVFPGSGKLWIGEYKRTDLSLVSISRN